ncbi:MAG: ATP-binding protein [Candidatus Hodarchaeales archaeon]
MSEEQIIGIVLSGGNTEEISFQLIKEAEKGKVQEGMMVLIKTDDSRKILGRISSIIPYNAFFSEGDAWSEARRYSQDIPEEIARQYEICRTELLMELPKQEIVYPPRPNDKVYAIDIDKHIEDIFGVKKEKPGYVWIGSLLGYQNAAIPLDIEKIPMHFAVFGVTGSGKSFNTAVLIEKLLSIRVAENKNVSYPMIIIDAHGDYVNLTELTEAELFRNRFCHQESLRFVFPNAFRSIGGQRSNIQRIGLNLNLLSYRLLAEMVITYYKGSIFDSDLQINGLVKLFEEAEARNYFTDDINSIFEDEDTFKSMISLLKEEKDLALHVATRAAIERALQEFCRLETSYSLFSSDSPLKDESFVDTFTKSKNIAIFDFSADGAPGIDLKTKQFVMAYLTSILFDQFTKFKINKEERYLLFIIEEAQNFCPSSSYPVGYSLSHNMLSAIATQGRKFGLSLGIITQRPSFVDKIILSMCNTFFIQRISPEDYLYVQNVTGGLPSSISRKLTNLETGKAIVSGQMLTTPFPLVIRINKGERLVEEDVGATSVLKTLSALGD